MNTSMSCLACCRFGAFFPDVAQFDAQLMGISAAEAVLLDPQQRLLMEAAVQLLASRGHGSSADSTQPQQQRQRRLGAYVGVASSDHGSLVKAFTPPGAFHATSNAVSVAAGRLSYTFGLSGPSLSVDTACSASLVALHLARQALLDGSCGSALVAGVHVQATNTSTSYVWSAGMLSPAGRWVWVWGSDGWIILCSGRWQHITDPHAGPVSVAGVIASAW